jgi:hypothetical protein
LYVLTFTFLYSRVCVCVCVCVQSEPYISTKGATNFGVAILQQSYLKTG